MFGESAGGVVRQLRHLRQRGRSPLDTLPPPCLAWSRPHSWTASTAAISHPPKPSGGVQAGLGSESTLLPLAAEPDPVGTPCEAELQEKPRKQKEPKEKDKKKKQQERAPRGTAGTFAGRRPPKDPHKLELFMARKAAREQAKTDARENCQKAPTLRQKEYWSQLKVSLREAGGDCKMLMKPPAAAIESTPPPKTKGNRETPEKVAQQSLA